LVDDQLGEFRLIYETGIQHSTLAPEKFRPVSGDPPLGVLDIGQLPRELLRSMQGMDMFSVGVVLCGLFLNGETLFTFE
jgi:hypothetical protein